MNRRRARKRLIADINITPFTDVVLVLLVIFMIATPLLIQAGIKIRPPEASSAEAMPENNVTIRLLENGDTMIDKHILDRDGLRNLLSEKIKQNPDILVVVNADRNIKYESVINVLDTARLAGANKFALSTENNP